MRTEIQLNLPSFDELVTEARSTTTVTPSEPTRSMNVIKTAVPVRRLKVAAYCRVSTDKEDQESSIRIQQEHFTSEAAKHDDWEFVGIYADIVSGTKKEKRPELNRLLADCERGAVNLVLTKSISRFARNTTDLLSMVRSLTASGTDIRFERENIDTRTMSSEFLLTILASLAEDESHSISANCRWGLQKRFENGTYRAANAPYGYDLADGNYAVNEEEAEIVREIFTRFLDGETLASIADNLNARGIPTKRAGQKWKGREISPECSGYSIRRVLNNVSYTGDQIFQKCFTDDSFKMKVNRGQYPQFHHEDHHPAIIDRETFDAVQALLEENRRRKPKKEKQHTTLSGMLVCSHCGSHLTRQVNSYCRVSTDHEDQETSFEAQQTHFTNLISGNPDWELVGIYADEESGVRANKRENFMRMIGDCEAGKIDMVLSKSISRWARNTLDSLKYIRKLKALEIPVFFTKENINTMDAGGEVLTTILSSLAQQESASISQNVQIGVRYHYQEGKVCSGVYRLLGYDRTPDGGLKIVPEEAEIIQRIYRDYLDGYSTKHIAEMLKVEGVDGSKVTATGIKVERNWNYHTIEYILKNEKYSGDLLLQKY